MKRATIGKHLHHHANTLEDLKLVRAINLLRWRTWVGVTQVDLGAQLGLGSYAVTASENELLSVGRDAEAAFAKFYGVDESELYLPDSMPWAPKKFDVSSVGWLAQESKKRLAAVKGEFVPSNATPAYKLKVLREKQRTKK